MSDFPAGISNSPFSSAVSLMFLSQLRVSGLFAIPDVQRLTQNPFTWPWFSCVSPSPQVAPPLPSRREAKPPPPPPKTRKSSVVSSEQGLQWGFGVSSHSSTSPGALLGNPTKDLLRLDSLSSVCLCRTDAKPDLSLLEFFWNSSLSWSCLSWVPQSQQLLPSLNWESWGDLTSPAWVRGSVHLVLGLILVLCFLMGCKKNPSCERWRWQKLHFWQGWTGTSCTDTRTLLVPPALIPGFYW